MPSTRGPKLGSPTLQQPSFNWEATEKYTEWKAFILELYRLEGKSADEWMGRLHVAATKCNYRELDRQLREQFIHGHNDKVMLDEIIRELTTKNNDEQMTSEGVLSWTKRIEVQRAQAAILNNITEMHQFNKIKVAQKSKENYMGCMPNTANSWHLCRYSSGIHAPRQCPVYGKMCTRCGNKGHFKKVCQSRR